MIDIGSDRHFEQTKGAWKNSGNDMHWEPTDGAWKTQGMIGIESKLMVHGKLRV